MNSEFSFEKFIYDMLITTDKYRNLHYKPYLYLCYYCLYRTKKRIGSVNKGEQELLIFGYNYTPVQ